MIEGEEEEREGSVAVSVWATLRHLFMLMNDTENNVVTLHVYVLSIELA